MYNFKRVIGFVIVVAVFSTNVFAGNKNIVTNDNDTINVIGKIRNKEVSVPRAFLYNNGSPTHKNVIIDVLIRDGEIQCHSENGMSEFNIISYDKDYEIANVDKLENADIKISNEDYDIILPFNTERVIVDKYLMYEINKLVVTNYKSGNTEEYFFVVEDKVSAINSLQSVNVNGETTHCGPVNIKGNNYFKIRDLATMLKGTNAQFNVWYDKDKNAVFLRRGGGYVPADLEQVSNEDNQEMFATKNSMNILVDNKDIVLDSYNINGYTYYKLRDISQVLGFEVDYDKEVNKVNILVETKLGAIGHEQ